MIAQGYQKAKNEWSPYITIAAYEEADEQALAQWMEKYAACQHCFQIGMIALSIMPTGGEHSDTAVLCLNPSHSKTLVDFYYGFCEK